jgi:diphosphoinositol-polyphosphate diphosphatase
MVTGCVPIVEGGKVLFVSASRKAEWILPKGGWEKDEPIEESAIRECFEEAGVLGVLGPRLTDYDYETRKAKKRRLEFEEIRNKANKLRGSPRSETTATEATQPSQEQEKHTKSEPAISVVQDPAEDSPRISKPPKMNQSDETSSVTSDSSKSHTHVRLSLFVLYVSEVKSSWPESGRSRKVVDIDEAIKMCESRPEFLSALKEVKERNLHHLPEQEKRNFKR